MAQAGSAAVVSGRVLDHRGRPLAGARVGFAAGPAGVALPDTMLLTDAQGRFALGAPAPGRYTLACHSDSDGSTQVAVDVTAGLAPPVLDVKLPGP
jgi:hypothetical protein